MRMLRALGLIAAALSAALVLAACGGDDDGGDASSEDEEQISAAIERSATGTDPSDCTEVNTQRFLEQTEFESGEEALESCEENAEDTAADTVDVSEIEVDGDSATAEASFSGGGLDSQVIAISLVKEGEAWKLDQLEEFVEFNQEAFADGLADEASEDGDSPEQLIDCIREQVRSTESEELQSAYLSGDQEQLLTLFGPCFGG